jgi:hypothetical protein
MHGIKIFFQKMFLIYLIAMLVSTSQQALAQSKNKGNFFARRVTIAAGADYSLLEIDVPAAAGINFAPRLFLTTTYSDFSFSAEAGLIANYRLDAGASKFSDRIFLQLPALIHVNTGHGASKDFRSAFGGFLGAGWNLQYDGSTTVNGLALDAGIRFWLFGKSFTLRYTHLPENKKLFSSGKIISLQINLGKYLEYVKANNKVSNFMKPYRK